MPATYPQIPSSTGTRTVPPSVLKAVGWVESGWRQFTPQERPLLSFDFGYGIMQITSGMAGAFGNVDGSLSSSVQSSIASNYRYNIAYGASVLARKRSSVPQIGNGDPAVVENWYYALWAYNGWGWVNNPNNPRFSHQGTPASDPGGFPYQERVLYLVAHPPRDAAGNPLWQPVQVSLPSRSKIGSSPGKLPEPAHVHRQAAPALSAIYQPAALRPLRASHKESVSVRVTNTGTRPWLATGSHALSVTYHLFSASGNPWAPFSPFSHGVVAFAQGTVPLPRALLPGQSATVRTTVQAPPAAGTYRVAWDLQQGSTTWLSQLGVDPRVEPLQVVARGQPLPQISATATPPPDPREGLKYLADTSLPDGSTVRGKESFRKGWLVFNNGTTRWGSGWSLHLVSGRPFGARTIAVPATKWCRTTNIIATLRAPAASGKYKSVWQIEDASGHRFGDRLTLVVRVAGTSPHPSPTPSPTPHPRPHPTVTATPEG